MDEDSLKSKLLEMKSVIAELQEAGRYDLLLQSIGRPLLAQLNIEAAKADLSPLLVTRDFRFILTKLNVEIDLSPIHKALYLLFLRHEEGIEFKYLSEYRQELRDLYLKITNRVHNDKIEETINRLTNPLDNAINEKCSRIKTAFAAHLDEFSLRYYIIVGHAARRFSSSQRMWFERKKTISLPRHLVIYE